jgi:phosphatidylcholine synthase
MGRAPPQGGSIPDYRHPVAMRFHTEPDAGRAAARDPKPPGTRSAATVEDSGAEGSASRRIAAYVVHLYTAAGVVVAFVAAAEITSSRPDVRVVFLLLALAVLIDSSDGPLARYCRVQRWAPEIDGRTIDDLIDYLTYTFIPLLLVLRMEWLPEPAILWIAPALIASLFGFANTGAKDEQAGFFLGFPSYWNVVVFYMGIFYPLFGPWLNALLVLGLTLLTLAPVGFIYPNLAPRPWRLLLIMGGLAWLALLLGMLVEYPHPPMSMVWLSLTYPALYVAASLHLWRRNRDVKTV